MGSSARGILVYGYNFGGDEGWDIHEADKYGSPTVDWLDPDDRDFVAQAMKRLFASVGFDDTWEPDSNYGERKKEAEARLGVKFETCSHHDYPTYVLATKAIAVEWGDAKVLDLPALMAEPAEHGWDDKLAAALAVLDISPKQEQPGWLLCAYYG